MALHGRWPIRSSRRRARRARRFPAFASYPHRGAAETKISIDGLSHARQPIAVLVPTVLVLFVLVPSVLVPFVLVPFVLVPPIAMS
ncbi:hypothetical protein [Candidatus Poriferisodalis sp.]|uniref:hypothetical protein n=1 Tax=Candidatus Poriferisodalis sp. TaxID=3101277 RepID=UPI003B52088F